LGTTGMANIVPNLASILAGYRELAEISGRLPRDKETLSISNVRQQIVDDFTRMKRLHHDTARLFPTLLID
jgi:hypothetical protein